MKTTTKKSTYEKVMQMPKLKHRNPLRPLFLLQILIRVLSFFELLPLKLTVRKHGMEKIGKKEPCLILMNHSSFADLQIASHIFFPKRYGIVTTTDGFVGPVMRLLMPLLGCIPTQKFVSDMGLIRDMQYMLKEKKTSVLMFPEAGYSFDGTATVLPRKMGILLKKLDVPVVTVITRGAYFRQPLYNDLQKRKTPIVVDVTCMVTREDLKQLSVAELDARLEEAFSFDNFRWQQENNVVIDAPFRADGLNRILYKCPHCSTEGEMEGKGIHLTCRKCGVQYELTETGFLKAENGVFNHVPYWYNWERQEVRKELERGTYRLDVEVDIAMLVNYSALYMVGEGRLVHTEEGFRLTGCDGKLDYSQGPLASHSLNGDYFWYEIGDMIGIGNRDVLYYCFPKNCGDVVAKTRLATEELYKMKKTRKPKTAEQN